MTDSGGSGNGLVLFMGESTEHAITAFQRYLPEVVYVVTSDKFSKQYKRRLETWSQQYNFRKGEVYTISDLFEESAASSILNSVIDIYRTESELQDMNISWYLGITGGTMNMAATGGYVGLLLAMKVFYVIKPPSGGKPMANRDIVEFPQLQGLGWLLHLPIELITYLGTHSGHMGEFVKLVPEQVFRRLYESELLILDDDTWFLTEEGVTCVEFVQNMPLTSKYYESMEKLDTVVSEINESFVGWV